jgi:flagellar biogenesis protein FliO
MSTALLAALALASLPAANPLSLPEGLSSTPILPAVQAPSSALPANALPFPTHPADAAAPISSAPNFASNSPSPLGLAGGALIILALGAATLWMHRRKRQGTRHIRVVETASLGPKRSLALVVVGRQSMLLSCCDKGIFLVSTQPATAEMLQGTDQLAAGVASAEPPTPLFGRVPSAAAAPAPGGFAVQLAEAEETQGLRRRLSEAGVLR